MTEPTAPEAPAEIAPDAWLWLTPKGKRRPQLVDLPPVLKAMAEGTSLRKACEPLGLDHASVYWALQEPGWRQHYMRAMEVRAIVLGEEALEIGRRATKKGEEGVEPNGARVLLDAIKWFNGKVAPKVFGDRMTHVGGGGDDEPIKHQLDLSNLSEADLAALEGLGKSLGLAGPSVSDRGGEGTSEG